MNHITPLNSGINRDSALLNKLAVSKQSYPVYFYVDTTKLVNDASFNKGELTFTADASHTLVRGSYCRLDDEVMYVVSVATNIIRVKRGQRGSVDTDHADNTKIYKEYDSMTEVFLNGADNPIPESQVVIDLQDPQFYDISLGIKVINVTDDNSGADITVHYAFSSESDIPLTDAGVTALALSKTSLTAIDLPNGTLNLYYTSDTIKPLARYLYIWLQSDAAVVTTNSCNFYININVV